MKFLQVQPAPTPPAIAPPAGLADYGLTLALLIWFGRQLWQAVSKGQAQADDLVLELIRGQQSQLTALIQENQELLRSLTTLYVKGVNDGND